VKNKTNHVVIFFHKAPCDALMMYLLRGACYTLVAFFLCVILLKLFSYILIATTRCRVPLLVVCSGSMHPALRQGDIALFANYRPPKVSDIVAFETAESGLLISHRVVRVVAIHSHAGSSNGFITRGDANTEDDFPFYGNGHYLRESSIVGICYAVIPKVGYVSLFLTSYPRLSCIAMLTILLCFTFT
jgi:signal peptidase I